MNMNRDRGNIKWNAMMLPEHVKYLREWQAEDKIEQRPEVDEWTLQQFADLLQQAYTHHLYVEIVVWQQTRTKQMVGYIDRFEPNKATIRMNNTTIRCMDICSVQLVDE